MYVEHPPHPTLARHVECYWTTTDGPVTSLVLPDGCMDILFSFDDPPVRADGTPAVTSAEPAVVGTMTRAIRMARRGRIDLLGIRFRPGSAPAWLSVSAREMVDGIAPLGAFWGSAAERAHERLGESRPEHRFRAVEDLLRSRLSDADDATDPRILHASSLLAGTGGAPTIERLAERVGLGRRQLERRFLETVGVSPKTSARIARFRGAAHLVGARPRRSLARIAVASGYADQAHLTREFRSFADTTPSAYRSALHTG